MEKTSDWSLFYQFEMRLMAKIVESSGQLYDGGVSHRPEYRSEGTGDGLHIPPQHVSWIGQTILDMDALAAEIEQLRSLYMTARKTKIKRLPPRFPQLFRDVEQINVVTNTAFNSRSVKRSDEFFTVKVMPLNEPPVSIERDMDALNGIGLEPRTVAVDDQWWLQVPTERLFQWAEADAIQLRKESGTAFRGTLRHTGQSAGIRINIGFLVIDSESPVKVVTANDQAPRPHRLASIGNRIELPVAVSYELFRK